MTLIGKSIPRIDGPGKIKGEAVYMMDYAEAGMLHARLLRSPVPAGRIVKLDVSKAASAPGVHAVVTAADVPNILGGWILLDQPLFAGDRVVHVGEPIAAVAAETLAEARAAIDLIDLEIEETPAVFDMESALAPGATLVHPNWETYERTSPEDFPRRGNVVSELASDQGDVDKAFAEAHVVVEDNYDGGRQYQGYLEPKATVATYREGRYTVHTGHQYPFNICDLMARFLGIRPSDVRVINHTVGGGFGGKLGAALEPYAAVLSKAAGGRPVKLVNTRSEDITTATCRENTMIRFRSAIDKDGNIIAREVICNMDSGAYAGELIIMPSVVFHLSGAVYEVGAARVTVRLVYTNTPPTGAMRGVVGVAMYSALERHMDHIARELGADRRDYRLRHLFKNGSTLLNGQKLDNAGILKEAFEAMEEAAPWAKLTANKAANRGVGIAAAIWAVKPLPGTATVKLNHDGTVGLITGTSDIGTGAIVSGCAQIVAEVLGVPLSDVIIPLTDTDTSSYDGGGEGNRTIRMVGKAAELAAREVRGKILELAAMLLQAKPDELEMAGGRIFKSASPDTQVALSDVAMASTFEGGAIAAAARHAVEPESCDPNSATGLMFPNFPMPNYHVHMAEVEVDPVSGFVKVERYVVVQEVGRMINPDAVIGQVQGAVAQGIGYALSESLRMKDGRCVESSLASYRLPLAVDIPRVEFIPLEHPDENGPFGARGVGEPAILLPCAVIGNAIADAVGKPIRKIPITPEDVLAALYGD